jgi:hypothetical protein
MNEIRIDRLSLQVPGLSAAEGRRLALQVAEGLGALGAAGGGRDIPTVRVDLTAASKTSMDELAVKIVAEVLRQVDRLT